MSEEMSFDHDPIKVRRHSTAMDSEAEVCSSLTESSLGNPQIQIENHVITCIILFFLNWKSDAYQFAATTNRHTMS